MAPPDDPTGCPNGRIAWDRYMEARMYSDSEIDAKVGALLANEIRQQNDLQRIGTGMRDLQADLVNAIIDHNRRLAALEKLLASVAG